MQKGFVVPIVLFLLLISLFTPFLNPVPEAQATPLFGSCEFRKLWEYSDKFVGEVPGAGRGYTWGDNTFGLYEEPYLEAPQGKRVVQYFDKSRMELSGNNVTNGLLTKELVTGQQQNGDNSFSQRDPSEIPVAGDPSVNNPSPTYATFTNLISQFPGINKAPDETGQPVTKFLERSGKVYEFLYPPTPVKIGYYEEALGHNVPEIFATFQNRVGKIWTGRRFANNKIFTDNPTSKVFGLPIAEPYWVKAKVGGIEKDVLVQLFERRVLTYTPSNPPDYQVEMGNIGQHYFTWRYNGIEGKTVSNSCTQLVPPPPRLYALGDSVMLGAATEMKRVIPGIEVDAGVSRQVSNGIEILKKREEEGKGDDIIIVHLGNNGSFLSGQFDEIMKVLEYTEKVIFINVKVERSWEAPNNTVINNGVRRYPKTVLIDWYTTGNRNLQYFWDDGIHLRPEGAAAYTRLISNRL
jgi:hypothetical protein